MFEITQLSFAYSGREQLFENLSLRLPKAEKWLLQGENGCGKSTLLKLLCGKLSPAAGSITCFQPTGYFYLPQQAESRILGINLVQDLQIWQMAGLDPAGLKTHPLVAGFAPQFWELPLHELSQGTKQAYLLAIALMHRQQYLILDEPYPALDLQRRQILTQALAKRRGLLLVSHYTPDIPFDHVLNLHEGRLW
jgi:ATPase subunit of ABC transporter with duplicated ATPase domains